MDDNKMVAGKVKKPGKRGRKPAKIDLKAKLERSRQSARECRARKKLRYQYLEELVSSKERAICALREELEMVSCCGTLPVLSLASLPVTVLLTESGPIRTKTLGSDWFWLNLGPSIHPSPKTPKFPSEFSHLNWTHLIRTSSLSEPCCCGSGAARSHLPLSLQYKQWCSAMDQGKIPSEIKALLTGDEQKIPQSSAGTKAAKNSKNSSAGAVQS
uniref:cAMP-responsive element-binding protein-like 2 n=1 Tax=Xiphophorus maculatus TaxID=8083 RepID=A0A3B5Q4D6_XIPMA